jgi:hypothetical protein
MNPAFRARLIIHLPMHSSSVWLRIPVRFCFDEETEEKDRPPPALVADQPRHTGEGICQEIFPLEKQTAFAEVAE